MKPLKSPTHIHFLTKNFYGFETVSHIMILWFSPCFICVLCRAKILPQIYTRIIASLKPPPIYAHYTRGKFRPRYIWEIAVRSESVGDWLSFGIFAFVCIMFCICGHRLDEVVFCWLVGRCQKFDCKSVIGLHKFIVKMWLCICNCMCICVCIWYWLWFCYRLDSVVIRL